MPPRSKRVPPRTSRSAAPAVALRLAILVALLAPSAQLAPPAQLVASGAAAPPLRAVASTPSPSTTTEPAGRLAALARHARRAGGSVVASATADGGSARVCVPGTLAARVEEAVCSVYGAEKTFRVRGSLAALSAGREHRQVLDASNPLMVQEATSFVDGLETSPWHDAGDFKWARKLEEKWQAANYPYETGAPRVHPPPPLYFFGHFLPAQVVRDELQAALADADAVAATGTNVWEATAPGVYGPGWRTLPLCDRTVWDETNAGIFPRTCELLHACKVPVVEAFFSSMAPRSTIAPHSDGCNFVLTAHLGLIVPEECVLTVGDGSQAWAEGKAMLFDTSVLHKARNDSDETRYILMMRVYHPGLSNLERKAMQLVFDCLDEPKLLDDGNALREYDDRRRALEAASRRPWEEALAARGAKGAKGGRRAK